MSLSLILQWVNGYVIADETGVRGRNMFGMTSFEAVWSEIHQVEIRCPTRGAATYIFYAGNQKLKLTNFPEADELLNLVRQRSPRVLII